jgi:hypothetical protein
VDVTDNGLVPERETEPVLEDVTDTDDTTEEVLSDDIEVPVPDALEQARPANASTPSVPRSVSDDIEVPIADALDQARPVSIDDEDDGYGRG